MELRVQPCTAATIEGHLARAIEFFESAEEERRRHPERANAWVTHYILAGIAAADVVCCRALGRHAQSDNHVQAVALLRSVQPSGPELAVALGVLLGMKTKVGYGERAVSTDDRNRAPRRARQLVDAARQRA
jgi:hypothetical protein